MTRVFLLLLLPAFAASAEAQRVEGTIRAGGETVPFATVRVADTAAGAAADAEGRYRLRLPAPGPFTLLFSAVGFAP